MTSIPFRDRILNRLMEDLVGPSSEREVLSDRPTQRYSTGILYPRGSRLQPQEDEDGGLPVNEFEDTTSGADTSGVSLYATLKPSAAGLSFAIERSVQGLYPSFRAKIRCATYERLAIDDEGQEVEAGPSDRPRERWHRIPHYVSEPIELSIGETRVDFAPHGISGLELYVLVTPHGGVLTVTAALSNRRSRGESSAFDEGQHFFQVELTIAEVSNGQFVIRPSRRAETDEDGRTAALIYRNVQEYVVGHTCSARTVLGLDGLVVELKTEWLPFVEVAGISDNGDPLFDRLRRDEGLRPLEAAWIAEASTSQLVEALGQVVEVYLDWIAGQREKVHDLPEKFRPQALEHVRRCERGAERMTEGVSVISDQTDVRIAFQLSQKAMTLQFSWTRRGQKLIWRPFQLAFQLLVLASLADRSHPDRETMDLLWFPTGGGKTEAYLALTAFVILFRRVRRSQVRDGVAVFMRYTLRLLTVQQFQRAAALICACELLRRRVEGERTINTRLGDAPISLGLWVGAAATPLLLKDAVNQPPGELSTPVQLLTCPSCGTTLNWKVTLKESRVECPSDDGTCEFASSGRKLPIWTIDEEIYRHAPSLLIATIDKFAQIVRKRETQVLFGRGDDSEPPDLIVQDELHLISGSLGSIAGLYEVAIDELCRNGLTRPKIIGSTATIRRAAEQARALFDRETYQFPAPGIDASNSGFAVTDTERPGRLHVGLSTAGRSATYMLQALVASVLQASTESGATDIERDYYWTLVVYFNSLRELGRALVLMQDDVPVSMGQLAAHRNEAPRKIDSPAELTSRVPSYEVRDMLDRLNRRASDSEAVDLLLASNMISVGMDIPRLGIMVINAQPKTLSEYIQATSRVGRGDVPGLVVTMYNNTRARDRSHFETFETWHRCLYRDIEATSVTPFAPRAQDKALHAVLVALVRHTVPGMDRKPVLNDLRRLDAESLAAVIEQRVARIDPAERVAISQKLKLLLDEWASRTDLQAYWDDYERRNSLLMSAEQFAAKVDVDQNLDPEGARRALWPTPNSMREVEAGTPFVLRASLKSEDN